MNIGKAVAIDAASTTTYYWTGYACNEMGLPLPLTLMLSMGAGMGTSYGLNRIIIGDVRITKYSMDRGGKLPDINNVDIDGGGIVIRGGSYDKLKNILSKYNLSEAEYLNISRTPQHQLPQAERELAFKIRMELTADVTNEAGVILQEQELL